MAAGQQKRRLNAVNLASCNIPEQHKGKKRKDLDLSPSILSFNPHISLEWKGKQKRAVARKDQVAISWRDLSPFIDGGQQSYSHARLADVFTVPHEIFELDNLQGLLSCQAWKMCLSASERKLLSQFLPKGIDVDQLLQSLFDGENFHFGNSFLEWGSLLCSGNLHPDAVIQRELIFKDNRKGYYSELQKYHNVMLEELQILKETWINSRDPANFQKLLRCRRNNTEYNLSSHADESAPLSLRENVGVTTDSGSSIGDDINDIWEERQEDSQERLTKPKVRRGVSISINKNVDNNLEEDDKIIRSQQIVKKLKLTSGSVKFKSLNRVLGDTKKLEDQPCGALEEDGDKKLHNHWLQIACTDIMAAFASHVERQSQISELKALLGQEIADKRRLVITQDGEKESGSSKQEEQDNASEDEDSDVAIENYEEDESSPSTGDNQALEHVPSFNSREEPDTASEEMEEDVNNSNDIGIEKNEAVSPPTLRQSLVRIPSLNGHEHELVFEETVEDVNKTDEMMLESCERDADESSVMCMTTDQRTEEEPCTAPGMSKFLEDAESAEDMVHAGGSTEDVWSTVNMAGGTYYDEGHDYSTVNKLRIRNQTVEEQPARMINLEEDILRDGDEDAGLCGPDDNVDSAVQANNGPSFFDTYEDVGPGQIISKPVLLKAQQSYSGHHVGEMKQQELPFTMGAGNSSDGFHFSQHLHEQRQQLLDERQAGEKELHPLHLMQNMYGYADKQPTRQVFTPTTNSIDWETDSARVLPFQPSAAGEMLDHHWGSYGGRTHSNWSALDVPLSSQGHCPGDGTAADGSLFGFVRQLNGFARSPYDTVGSHQYVGPSAYAGGVAPQGDEMQCQGHSAQFAYLNQQYGYIHPHQDATRHRPNGSMAWMNMPLAAGVNAEMMHQSSIMHDSVGKPFLGSWNQ